jgi:hypothetical protein
MSKPDLFGRAAAVVADLDSPFYAEERQRDVWNEASAVGFQTMLWGGLVLSCAMVWLGGRPLVGWAVALLALIAVAARLTLVHANRQGVTGTEDVTWKRPRLVVAAVLYLATVAGVVVHCTSDTATLAGVAVGVVVALVAMAVGSRRARAA